MTISDQILIRVPHTIETRAVLHRLADDAFNRMRSAASYDEAEAWRLVSAQIKIALEPEQLEELPTAREP